jgi:hypothetical protein
LKSALALCFSEQGRYCLTPPRRRIEKNDNTAGMRLPGSIAKAKENKRM